MSLATEDGTDVSNTGAGSRADDSPRRTGALASGLLIAVIVLAVAAIASLAVGNRAIDPATVLQALFAYDDENPCT